MRHDFHEKAVKSKLKFTSTRIPWGVGVHGAGVEGLIREPPPAPLGDGRGEAPGRGFGGEPGRGRAGVRSAGGGAAAPCLSRKQWSQASIRTRAGDGSVAFDGAVHALIRCFHDWGKGGTSLSCSRTRAMPGSRRDHRDRSGICSILFHRRVFQLGLRRRGGSNRRWTRRARGSAAARRGCARRPPRLCAWPAGRPFRRV